MIAYCSEDTNFSLQWLKMVSPISWVIQSMLFRSNFLLKQQKQKTLLSKDWQTKEIVVQSQSIFGKIPQSRYVCRIFKHQSYCLGDIGPCGIFRISLQPWGTGGKKTKAEDCPREHHRDKYRQELNLLLGLSDGIQDRRSPFNFR